MRLLSFLLFVILGVTACAPVLETGLPAATLSAPTPETPRLDTPLLVTATAVPLPTTDTTESDLIILPLSLYILDDAGGKMTSGRDEAELRQIIEGANEIWGQANIRLEIQTIQRLTVPDEVMQQVAARNFGPFFAAANRDLEIENPSLLNGFYAKEIGGVNGVTPANTRTFFVTDQPTVHDERVTSHEIGHILGLHHVLTDPNRLLFSGTNGMELSPEEIVVARYNAQGILDGLR